MMKVYVASSWRNEFQQDVVRVLREDGYQVYDYRAPGDGWKAGVGKGGFAWSEVDRAWKEWPENIEKFLAGLQHPRAIEGFRRDMDALMQSDACVAVGPFGVSAGLEIGWACGAGKFVAIYLPGMREPELMMKMADYIGQDLDRIRDMLRQCIPQAENRRDLEALFDVRWRADMRAIKRWQEATGKYLIWPDHADLCVWLMDQLNLRADQKSWLQCSVAQWFERNGGNTTLVAAIDRTAQELEELRQAGSKNLTRPAGCREAAKASDLEHAREEAADVGLCLMLAAECAGFDLLDAMAWKHSINKARQWCVDDKGCLRHIKGTDPRDV